MPTYEPSSFNDKVSIGLRVFLAWIVSVVLSCTILLPLLSAANHVFVRHDDIAALAQLKEMLNFHSLGLSIFGLWFTAPVFLIALVTALLFQKSIEENLTIWCVVAPIPVYLYFVIIMTFAPHAPITQTTSMRLINVAFSLDLLEVLMSATIASAIFNQLTRNHQKKQQAQ